MLKSTARLRIIKKMENKVRNCHPCAVIPPRKYFSGPQPRTDRLLLSDKMATKTLCKILKEAKFLAINSVGNTPTRSVVMKESGALCPPPKQVSFGLIRVILTVIPGLLIGASISKTIANFLEENDLFVPSDDDDDDD